MSKSKLCSERMPRGQLSAELKELRVQKRHMGGETEKRENRISALGEGHVCWDGWCNILASMPPGYVQLNE